MNFGSQIVLKLQGNSGKRRAGARHFSAVGLSPATTAYWLEPDIGPPIDRAPD